MDTLTINNRVRTGKINKLKNAHGWLCLGKTMGFQTIFVNNHHFTWLHITDKFCSHHIKAAAFRAKNIAPILQSANAKRSEALRVPGSNQLILSHNCETVGTLDFL